MDRVKVGIRELRLNLSRYVARARTGTEVIVTDHGHPVARLVQIEDDDALYERLVREGRITPASRPKSKRLPPLIDAGEVTGSVSELLLKDRR